MTRKRPVTHSERSGIPSAATNLVDVALIAVFRRFRERIEVLIARRRSDADVLAGQWEIPGGKIEKGESPVQAAARELLEELHIECDSDSPAWIPLGMITPPPPLGRPAPRFFLFALELPAGAAPRALASEAIEWVDRSALAKLPWPQTNQEVITAITRELGKQDGVPAHRLNSPRTHPTREE